MRHISDTPLLCSLWFRVCAGFYILLTALIVVLILPMLLLKEPNRPDMPVRSLKHFAHDVWSVRTHRPRWKKMDSVLILYAHKPNRPNKQTLTRGRYCHGKVNI